MDKRRFFRSTGLQEHAGEISDIQNQLGDRVLRRSSTARNRLCINVAKPDLFAYLFDYCFRAKNS